MCAALASFACLDTTAKYLSQYVDTRQVVWVRYTGAFVYAFALFNPLTRPGLLKTQRPVLQIVRALLVLGATTLGFTALRYLQLDQVLTIMFSTPFLVTALSGPLLGEWVKWRRWTAVCVGFLGVLLVTRPGVGGIHPAALFSVGAAICYATFIISTRVLSRTDSDETTLFYSNLVGVLALAPTLPFVWTTPTDPLVIVLMIVIGAFGSFGHYLFIVAHRLAPAAVLAPFIYTQFIYVIAFGYLVFGNVPNRWTLAGAAIVIASGLYIINRERKVRSEA
jgi:drug/metabolite transporter (DMT)-like permease